ncbi:MAG: hypothetical protein AB7F43_06300 [Bacteriovoracia bacterium]
MKKRKQRIQILSNLATVTMAISLVFAPRLVLGTNIKLSDLNPRNKKTASRGLASDSSHKANDIDPPYTSAEAELQKVEDSARTQDRVIAGTVDTPANKNISVVGVCRHRYGQYAYGTTKGSVFGNYENCMDTHSNNLTDQIQSYQRGAGVIIRFP